MGARLNNHARISACLLTCVRLCVSACLRVHGGACVQYCLCLNTPTHRTSRHRNVRGSHYLRLHPIISLHLCFRTCLWQTMRASTAYNHANLTGAVTKDFPGLGANPEQNANRRTREEQRRSNWVVTRTSGASGTCLSGRQ